MHATTRRIAATFLAAVLAATVPAQGLPPFAGPFIYDPGPIIFGAFANLVDLDGDGRDDLFERPITIPASSPRYRLANPNGTLGPLYDLPPTTFSASIACNDVGDGTAEIFTFPNAPTCPNPAISGFLNAGRTCAGVPALGLTPFVVPVSCPGVLLQLQSAVARGPRVYVAYTAGAIVAYDFQLPASPGSPPTATPIGTPYLLATPNVFVTSVALRGCELNGDGIPDLVIRSAAPFQPSTLEIVLGTASGLALNAPMPFIPVPGFLEPTVGVHDLTGDGKDDILLNTSGGYLLFVNQGVAPGGGVTFAQVPFAPPGFFVADFGDVDGDGDEDLIGTSGGQIHFALNAGNATFTPAASSLLNPGNGAVAAGDIDGDGDVDLVSGGMTITTYLNQLFPTVAVRPGTYDGIGLQSGFLAGGLPPVTWTQSPFFDIKAANAVDELALRLNAPASWGGLGAYLLIEFFPTGCPPSFPVRKVYASFTGWTSVVGPLAIPGNVDLVVGVQTPPIPGPLNISAVCQFVVLAPQVYNGQYAATEAHEFQY